MYAIRKWDESLKGYVFAAKSSIGFTCHPDKAQSYSFDDALTAIKSLYPGCTIVSMPRSYADCVPA